VSGIAKRIVTLMLGTSLASHLGALAACAALAAIETGEWLDERHSITVSVGVATSRAGAETVSALLSRADTARYAAKHAGGNRVVPVRAGTRSRNSQARSCSGQSPAPADPMGG
jgi:diguanylate cyclase (GGDEF)-like protein